VHEAVLWFVTPRSSESARERPAQTTKQTFNLLLLLFVSFLSCYSTLKMQAKCSSETSGSLRTTRRYKPEDRELYQHSHRPEVIAINLFLTVCFMVWWIGRHLEGSDHVLTEILSKHSPGGTEVNHYLTTIPVCFMLYNLERLNEFLLNLMFESCTKFLEMSLSHHKNQSDNSNRTLCAKP
jgi:hypothetical protein